MTLTLKPFVWIIRVHFRCFKQFYHKEVIIVIQNPNIASYPKMRFMQNKIRQERISK